MGKRAKRSRRTVVIVVAVCLSIAAAVIMYGLKNTPQREKKEERILIIETEVQQSAQEETESISVLTEQTEAISTEQPLTEETETPELPETESETLKADAPNGYTVVLDPGHQGSGLDMSGLEANGPGASEMKAKATTGTVGVYSGIPEYQLNLDISLMLQQELESRGYRVVMTRTDNNTAISNSERAIMAAENGGDIFVRIHANGSDDHSIHGALGMAPTESNPYVSELYHECLYLSNCIVDSYCEATGLANLGIQFYDDMTGINWSKIPVTILEMGFMSNEYDDLFMADEESRKNMVLGIANGIDRYFE